MLLDLTRAIVAFDLETTGLNPHLARIVEIGAVRLHPDGTRTSLDVRLNPECPIPAETTAIHGIRDADVADAPRFADVAEQVAAFFSEADLAGFGILRFDLPLLRRELRDAGIEFDTSQVQVLDAQRIYHLREPRDLAAALAFYCGRDHTDAHSARADAVAAWDVLQGQLTKYADLPHSTRELGALCNPRAADAVDDEGKLRWRDGQITVAFGQKSGLTLRDLAEDEPAYLRWMLNKDFSAQVKSIVRDALQGRFAKAPAAAAPPADQPRPRADPGRS